MRRFGLISDTHGSVHPDVHKLFRGVEYILHAGDVGGEEILDELGLIAPVEAVCGNTDYSSPRMPLHRLAELPFGKVGIMHGHQQPDEQSARARALAAAFEPAGVRLIMHGHSHQQYLERRKNFWIVNPGAACRPRFHTVPSVCILEWDPVRDSLRFDFQPLVW